MELPAEKMVCYIHNDNTEIGYGCGLFDFIDVGNIGGFAYDYEIHNKEVSLSIIHEGNHMIFDQLNKSASVFYAEGIQTWYEFSGNAPAKKDGIKMALQYKDENIIDVIQDKDPFFIPEDPDKYYYISGLFTEFLIENYGLDSFKRFYRQDIQKDPESYTRIYQKDLPELLEDYKRWLEIKYM